MEISQKSQALLAESSHQPPPILSVPQILNSSPFVAPPLLPNNIIEDRKIPKPTVRTKRTIPDKIPQNCSENIGIDSAFLPKKLVEVFAIRQRRELVWHARILIFTSTISYTDSTFAIFDDKTGKEEVSAFKVYLGLVIASYTTANSSQNPSQVTLYTLPGKANGYDLRKDTISG